MAYNPKTVEEAWFNHFKAFGAQDVDGIMLDYNETSLVRVHNSVTGATSEHQGLKSVREFFIGLFKDLSDLSTLKAPGIVVEEDPKQVFLVWECPGCGFESATDTFIFGDDFKIKRQNILVTQRIYAPKTVQEAWDNHFAAFGGQNVAKIMLDYDETSVVQVHDNVTGTTSEHKGLKAISDMFVGLFGDLSDLATLQAPVANVDEATKQVFLVWRCPGCGYKDATDTFIFGDDFKIKRQNIVVTKNEYAPKTVQEAWDNHFAAFGGQNVAKIMLDYDETSVVQVHDNVTGTTSDHKGVKGIRDMFVGLFGDLSDLATLQAPVVNVDEATKQVFLVWRCPGVGYKDATDTFIFGDDFKIKRQNIVVTKEGVSK